MPEQATTLAKYVAATTHGRYLVQCPEGSGPHPLLVGFHGYAEQAELHLTQLQRIPGITDWLVASVQALHPFYRGKAGEVVASWMTKQDRELAIQDNVQYVANVAAQIKSEYEVDDVLVYAGFSQGVAMAYRAAALAGHPCRGLVVLGGDVPPEIGADASIRLPPVLLGRGRSDEYYTQQKLDEDVEVLTGRSKRVETLVFEGGHEWTEEFLEAAGSFLHRILYSSS